MTPMHRCAAMVHVLLLPVHPRPPPRHQAKAFPGFSACSNRWMVWLKKKTLLTLPSPSPRML